MSINWILPTLRGDVPANHGLNAQGKEDTGENLPLTGVKVGQKSQSGVTPYVPQLPQEPLDADANADCAQSCATSAKEIMRYLKLIEARQASIEWKVDKLISQQNTLTQIKNEQLSMKTSLATIEGLLTTIKIMDPGVGSGATAAQAKRLFKEAPVVVSGPMFPGNPLEGATAIQLDDLARPKPFTGTSQKAKRNPDIDLAGHRATLTALLKECSIKGPQLQNLEKRIGSLSSEAEFKQIRRDIIRSVV